MLASTRDRFETKYVKGDGCWLWNASTYADKGYGVFYYDGVVGQTSAHRASWLLNVGPIPEGIHVLHKCDVLYPVGDLTYRRCVRPDHLFLGTHDDNMVDRHIKGRQVCGEDHGLAKLTDRKVLEIRAAYAAGISPAVLGRFYDLDRTGIWLAATKASWSHVEGSLAGDDIEELLLILNGHEKAYREEVREKCRRGNAMTLEKTRAKVAAKALETHRLCKGSVCLAASDGAGVTKPIEDFYISRKATGARWNICKVCLCKRQKDIRERKAGQ